MGPTEIVLILAFAIIGIASGYFIANAISKSKLGSAQDEAARLIEDARSQSENLKKEAELKAKDEVHSLRKEAEQEIKEQKTDIQAQQKRIQQREESLDLRMQEIDGRLKELMDRESKLSDRNRELDETLVRQQKALEQVAGMSAEDAKRELISQIEDEAKRDAAIIVKEIETTAKDEADKKAQWIVAGAIQRCASDHVAESTVSVVSIPSDDMKGRIIGREGRNIRIFEQLTGINLIIDDTPEAVILSSFDPVRREIGRVALEYLITDGRIHPARIEEMFEKAKREVDVKIKEAGEHATMEAGVFGLHAELVKALGRLKYRTSYGQNVLIHSVEVAHLAGLMAAELGTDIKTAKRAGLLHDIGKGIDQEIEGSHASIGGDLARRLGEQEIIIHAIEAHHEEVEPKAVEPVLVQAADAVSSARPGARRETLESYIKRLEKLEEIATSHKGVEKCYAMQAGREIRIMVKPTEVDDSGAYLMAKEIAKTIEEEMEYPGQIKVTVIRENRVTEFAK